MGQVEVLEWFRKKYLSEGINFFKVSDVCKDFENHKVSVRRCILRLYAYGYLDIKLIIGKPASYCIKEKYIKNGRL